MAFTLVQTTNSGSTGNAASPTLAFGSNVAAGNLLVVGCSGFQSPVTHVNSVTDTRGNTYAKAVGGSGGNTRISEIWYIVTPSGGACTVTVNWSASTFGVLEVAEFTIGGAGSVAVEGSAVQENLAVIAHSSGNSASTTAGDLILGCYADAGANTAITATGAYTMASGFSPSASMQGALEYLLSGAASVQNASFASAAATTSEVSVAAFKFVASGAVYKPLAPGSTWKRRYWRGLHAPLPGSAPPAAPPSDPGTTIVYGYGSN